MAIAGIAPDANVDLQVVWWMSREEQRREKARWAFMSSILGGDKNAAREALRDEED